MADSDQILAIQEQLAAAGIIAPSAVTGVFDDALEVGLNRFLRFSASLLDVEGIDKYSIENAQTVLDAFKNEDPAKLKQLRTFVAENPNLDLSTKAESNSVLGKAGAFLGSTVDKAKAVGGNDRDYGIRIIDDELKAAGIPAEDRGALNMSEFMKFVDDPEAFVTQVNAVVSEPENAKKMVVAEKARVEAIAGDLEIVLKTIGQPGAKSLRASAPELNNYNLKLQTEMGFVNPYGAYDQATSDGLRAAADAGTLLGGMTSAADMIAYANSMDVLSPKAEYISIKPDEPMSVDEAKGFVKAFGTGLATQFNPEIEKLEGQTGISAMLFTFGASAMGLKTPKGGFIEVDSESNNFNIQTQALTQQIVTMMNSLAAVSSGEPDNDPSRYTQAKADRFKEEWPAIKKQLGQYLRSEDQIAMLEMLTPKSLEELFGAMDVLQNKGVLYQSNLLNADGGLNNIAPQYTKYFQERLVDEYAESNPAMLRVADMVTHAFTGMGPMDALMSGLDMQDDLYDGVNRGLPDAAQFAAYYTEALDTYMSQEGATREGFNAEIYHVLHTVVALPFGDQDGQYQEHFHSIIDGGIKAASAADQANAGAAFAASVNPKILEIGESGFDSSYKGHSGAYAFDAETLAMPSIIAGGKEYSPADIRRIYNNFQLENSLDGQGSIDPDLAATFAFRDDAGAHYEFYVDPNTRVMAVRALSEAEYYGLEVTYFSGGGDLITDEHITPTGETIGLNLHVLDVYYDARVTTVQVNEAATVIKAQDGQKITPSARSAFAEKAANPSDGMPFARTSHKGEHFKDLAMSGSHGAGLIFNGDTRRHAIESIHAGGMDIDDGLVLGEGVMGVDGKVTDQPLMMISQIKPHNTAIVEVYVVPPTLDSRSDIQDFIAKLEGVEGARELNALFNKAPGLLLLTDSMIPKLPGTEGTQFLKENGINNQFFANYKEGALAVLGNLYQGYDQHHVHYESVVKAGTSKTFDRVAAEAEVVPDGSAHDLGNRLEVFRNSHEGLTAALPSRVDDALSRQSGVKSWDVS